MKLNKLLVISTLAIGGIISLGVISTPKNKAVKVSAISTNGCSYVSRLSKNLDLNESSEQEIRNYYQSLTSLGSEELTGNNLLKNLKPILYEMNYFSYENIWKIYEITDRDWEAPDNGIKHGTYDEVNKTVTGYQYGSDKDNPVVHALYRDPSEEGGEIRAWGDHKATGINREHVWCQSRGFSAADTSKGAEGPAGTDLHHLIAADGYVNQSIHNNNPYGYVKTASGVGKYVYNKNNKVGSAKTVHAGLDVSDIVFEPQDCDKGDIARAIFYMAARYNNWSGSDTITDYEPNLLVANFATSNGEKEYSTATKPVTMGILQDLLEWNKLDPVDEYERYRNDLIYKNYQGNRNPFVDFPQWADYIWGVSSEGSYDPTPLGSANPSTDTLFGSDLFVSASTIKLKTNSSEQISATTVNNSQITWTVNDDSLVSLSKSSSASKEKITVTSLDKEGDTVITASATIEGQVVSREIKVIVSNEVPPSPDPEPEQKPLDMKMILIIAAVAVVVIVAVIVIYASASKKNKKKMKSGAKKVYKSVKKSTRKRK